MKRFILSGLLTALLSVAACVPQQGQGNVFNAVAVLRPTSGNEAEGTVYFTETPRGVRVEAEIIGLNTGELHAFHIHEYGDTTSPNGTSAGAHYDPEGTERHALPGESVPHHAGDLGNLSADGDGRAVYNEVISGLTITRQNAIIGRAVVVHSDPDDGSQPAGDAGGRIAIGVIGVAGTPSMHDQQPD